MNTTVATSIIQSQEGSHGDGEKGIVSSSPQLEPKSDDVAMDLKPLVGADHKRKASTEIDSFGELQPHSNDSHHVNPPPISPPTTRQIVDQQMVSQGGENEKKEGDEGVTHGGGPLVFNLNEVGTVDSPHDIEQERVKTNVEEIISVTATGDKGKAPHGGLLELDLNKAGIGNTSTDAKEEIKVESSALDRIEVDSHAIETKNQVHSSTTEKIEVRSYEHKNDMDPAAIIDKIEGNEPSSVEKHEVEPVKIKGFRSPVDFDLDLNELPPMDDDEN
ncbi:hypothetical protein VNO78_08553 [Psophocarpus tetragonolobus]|uniref:Uncharacterized protein n=1 Tax=Psophocarpus tetragonolobus TaxID=3891 RepID=A0AAN9T5X6_PSOTE